MDGSNFHPLMPQGVMKQKFPCGRHYGYESGNFHLPKSIVSEEPVMLQLEYQTEFGTIVQCADIIVQKIKPFVVSKCEPSCKNGGVCQNGECKCSKMYFGDSCENQGKFHFSNVVVDSSGMGSIFLFIFLVALVNVGILFLRKSDEYQAQLASVFPDQQVDPNAQFIN